MQKWPLGQNFQKQGFELCLSLSSDSTYGSSPSFESSTDSSAESISLDSSDSPKDHSSDDSSVSSEEVS